ncbi:MAG: tRNA pseudouridine(38-40) synthase TruA, partial [Ilumatobacteraceae bacterium]
MLRRAKLIVAYDGTLFHGFADNDGVRTVMGVLREAMERVVRQPVELVGAGRTDAGVHAWGQVVSCDLPEMDLDALERRVNRMCGPEVV